MSAFQGLSDAEKMEAADALFEEVQKLVDKYKSPDMSAEKILQRIAVVAATANISRTAVFGSIAFGGLYAPVVGISKETLLGLVSDLYDATEANPATPETKAAYAKANAEFHTKVGQATGQQLAKDLGFDDDLGGGKLLSPMPKLKQ